MAPCWDNFYLVDPLQIEEFHFWGANEAQIKKTDKLLKLLKGPERRNKVLVGYRSREDVNKSKALQFTAWHALMKDIKSYGKDIIRDYFIDTNWDSSHLKTKWNKVGYKVCAALVKDPEEAAEVVRNHYGE